MQEHGGGRQPFGAPTEIAESAQKGGGRPMEGEPSQHLDVYSVDVRELQMPAGSIGTICCDPPFAIGHRGTKIVRAGGKFGVAKTIDTTVAPWDVGDVVGWEEYVPLFWDWLAPNGILIMFHDKLKVGDIARWWEAKGGQVRHIAAWCLTNAAPQARKVKWRNASNFILIATKNRGSGHAYRYTEGQGSDYFVCPMVPGVARVKNAKGERHPTEKPVKIFADWLLKWWGDRSLPILDPFCGSGSIGVAAAGLGFQHIILSDVDPLWADAAKARVGGEIDKERQKAAAARILDAAGE